MKFLVAYDGTDAAKAALTLARTHAEIFKASVLVINSMKGGESESTERIGKAERDLAFAEKYLQEKGISCGPNNWYAAGHLVKTLSALRRKTMSTRYLLG